jgi:hypothetical protein
MSKVRIDHILAQLGVGEMTSEEELEELTKKLRADTTDRTSPPSFPEQD